MNFGLGPGGLLTLGYKDACGVWLLGVSLCVSHMLSGIVLVGGAAGLVLPV